MPSYRRLSRFSALGYRRGTMLIKPSSTFSTTTAVANSCNNNTNVTSTPYWLWIISGIAIAAIFEDGRSSTNSNHIAYCEHRHKETGVDYETGQVISNWSNTHQCNPTHLYEPKSSQEVLRLLQYLHRKGWEKARPIGTALSPNGIGMSDQSLIAMHSLDYVEVDPVNRLVTVGAGVRVSEVLKSLEKHNLTLQNFSSIQEQQLAGWTQVAAHGTGCTLPTVDDMIVRMKLATATAGLMTLSNTSNPKLFSLAKVGLGVLGVVTELTLQCVPKHSLLEHTFSLSLKDIGKDHLQRLRDYHHVRYMWLPYTSDVIAVVSNPVGDGVEHNDPAKTIVEQWQKHQKESGELPTKPLYELLLKCERRDPNGSEADELQRVKNIKQLSFSQLRDRLLDFAPLDVQHIQAVNQAEAEFWKMSTGSREDDSTKILGFDCGGEQFVFEVCFPIGSVLSNSFTGKSKDIEFVQKLINIIEKHQIPAHCPIEQRWTARSSSKMSPAYSENPDEVFSWVGIIMYLPPHQTPQQREEIAKQFQRYTQLIQPLLNEYDAHCHWAKIELPKKFDNSSQEDKSDTKTPQDVGSSSWWTRIFGSASSVDDSLPDEKLQLKNMRERIRNKYPVEEFNDYRKVLDPKGILSNKLIDSLFNDN